MVASMSSVPLPAPTTQGERESAESNVTLPSVLCAVTRTLDPRSRWIRTVTGCS